MLYLMRRKLEKVLEKGLATVEVMQDDGTPCKFFLSAPGKAPTYLDLQADHFVCMLRTAADMFEAHIPYQRIIGVEPYSPPAPKVQ